MLLVPQPQPITIKKHGRDKNNDFHFRSFSFSPDICSCAGVLPAIAAFPGVIAGRAINTRVVYAAGLPADRAGGCLLAQPLAAHAAMGFSRRFILLHADTPCSSCLSLYFRELSMPSYYAWFSGSGPVERVSGREYLLLDLVDVSVLDELRDVVVQRMVPVSSVLQFVDGILFRPVLKNDPVHGAD